MPEKLLTVPGLRALGLDVDEPDAEGAGDQDREPDFDGGAREPAPLPSDPVAEHDELIADLSAAKQVSRGFGGWRLA